MSVSFSISHNFISLNDQDKDDSVLDSIHSYTLRMKGVDKIDLEQEFTTEIKYSLDIQQNSDKSSDIHTHEDSINLDSDFSGVILNSTL